MRTNWNLNSEHKRQRQRSLTSRKGFGVTSRHSSGSKTETTLCTSYKPVGRSRRVQKSDERTQSNPEYHNELNFICTNLNGKFHYHSTFYS